LRSLSSASTRRIANAFIGQLDPALDLKSVKGMSGGPIFGFCREPQLRYWVVALQSSWNAEKRIVYGCSLPVLASLMTEWVRKHPAPSAQAAAARGKRTLPAVHFT
jgi:hypothetical protein